MGDRTVAVGIVPLSISFDAIDEEIINQFVEEETEGIERQGEKGGPGSGNWGHTGYPGRGGSSAGTGAAYSLGRYLSSVREGLSRKNREEFERVVREAVDKKFPDRNEQYRQDATKWYLDGMSVSKPFFRDYGKMLGINQKTLDSIWEEMDERKELVDRELMRRKLRVQDRATYTYTDDEIEWSVPVTDQFEDMERKLPIRKVDEILDSQYETTTEYGEGHNYYAAREHFSTLLRVAEEVPAIQQVLRYGIDKVVVMDAKREFAGQWDGSNRTLYLDNGSRGSSDIIHECGHAVVTLLGLDLRELGFGSGPHVSSYSWKTPGEDFAEIFTAFVGGVERDRIGAWMPEKWATMADIVRQMENYTP